MEKETIQKLIDAQNKTMRVLEEIAQLIARLDKRSITKATQDSATTTETSFTTVNIPNQINISNVPLPTTIAEQPIGVTIENTPIPVSQSGTWGVDINNTPIEVSQSGTWTVGISGQPIQTRYQDVLYAPINATASGDTQIVAGVSGKRIRVIAYAIVASATVNVKFRSNTTDITGAMRIVEGGGIAHAYDQGLFQTAVSESLNINLSNNATVGGYVVYREV